RILEAAKRLTRNRRVLAQPCALAIPRFPSLLIGALHLLIRCARRLKHISQCQQLLAVEVKKARGADQPARLKGERARARHERMAAVAPPVVGERALERSQEPLRPALAVVRNKSAGRNRCL